MLVGKARLELSTKPFNPYWLNRFGRMIGKTELLMEFAHKISGGGVATLI